MNRVRKIGLGTAQWGMPYGVANRSGQPDDTEILNMLLLAKQSGVTTLDTAYVYGGAESILGQQNICELGFDIVTKTIPIQCSVVSRHDIELVSGAFTESLQRLKCEQVYGLLVHRADNLMSPGGDLLWARLKEFKAQKRVSKIGVSVYRPQQIEAVLKVYDIDLVQVPFNIYDQRFVQTGLFRQLKQDGIEIHARSVFLQGLLLMKPDDLPDQFGDIRDHQSRLHDQLSEFGLTPLEGCLDYCLNQTEIDKVVIGCETTGQVVQILQVALKESGPGLDLLPYCLNDQKFIDPSKWLIK